MGANNTPDQDELRVFHTGDHACGYWPTRIARDLVLDPRDLKYCATDCSAHWRPEHDAFRWREKIPFARWGLAELQIMGWPLLALTVLRRS